MTNTKEPRQWWIYPKTNHFGVHEIYDAEPFNGNWKEKYIHVVEHEDYESLQEKLRIAREALVKIDNELTCSAAEFVPSIGAAFDIIDKALALINKTEGE